MFVTNGGVAELNKSNDTGELTFLYRRRPTSSGTEEARCIDSCLVVLLAVSHRYVICRFFCLTSQVVNDI
jgi:hypothetical protein